MGGAASVTAAPATDEGGGGMATTWARELLLMGIGDGGRGGRVGIVGGDGALTFHDHVGIDDDDGVSIDSDDSVDHDVRQSRALRQSLMARIVSHQSQASFSRPLADEEGELQNPDGDVRFASVIFRRVRRIASWLDTRIERQVPVKVQGNLRGYDEREPGERRECDEEVTCYTITNSENAFVLASGALNPEFGRNNKLELVKNHVPLEVTFVPHHLEMTPASIDEMLDSDPKEPGVTAKTATLRLKKSMSPEFDRPAWKRSQEKSEILRNIGRCDARSAKTQSLGAQLVSNEVKSCEYGGSGTSHFDGLGSNTLAKFIIKPLADSSNETQQFVILIKNVLYLFVFKSRLALVLYHALTLCPHAAVCFKVEEKDGGKFTAVPKFGYCITVQITVGLLRPDYTGSAVNAIRDYFGEAEFGGNSGGVNDPPGMTQSDFEQKRCSIIEAIRNRSAAETAEKRAACVPASIVTRSPLL
ncbi:hypothetical protein M885DRAFT_603549 [Pelagophyceae sp. CCMP2097]|nr:hypothetical protein M885DRAFT_603549 [Pelagophyceae sp. CCMP2097]